MTRCVIDSVAFGGDGVARWDGLVVFTPFTLPEETVEVEICQKKSNFARASLKEIITKNPKRIDPPCPYFTKCGGCQLQHANYPYQLELKKKFIEDSLRRIGKIEFPVGKIFPSTKPFGYRRHISLRIRTEKNTPSLGFASHTGSFLPINSCLIFNEPEDPILLLLKETLEKLSLPLEGRVKIIKGEKGYVVTFVFEKPISEQNEQLLGSLIFADSVTGIIVQTPKKETTFGDVSLSFVCNDLTFAYSPCSFIQNHQEQSTEIYNRILDLLKNARKILDLYCGIGISTLLLAKEGKEMIGVEINPSAVALAKQNALTNNLQNVTFSASSADSSASEYLESFMPDAILVNPPKTGLSLQVKESLCFKTVEQIVYISCDPPTLSRDLAYLTEAGFIIKAIEGFDMFPQTTHVETVVYLVK